MQVEQLGPYRIGRKLGKGGMGAVFEAVDETTGQRVAVKALSPQLATAEGFRERFEAEIESLKKLQHDGIVRLYGYGEDDGILFYSMELVDGPSLEQELNEGRRFHWRETLSIAIQLCRALKHAHDHGIVHRDIKPANLLLTSDERVKIADFGIARLFGGTSLTMVGGVLGTADYMSPEQVDGGAVTDRCDQYALGCVMFALLAGRPPFRAATMAEMLQLQRFAEPEPVRRYAPSTPEQLDRLIMQLLSKDPGQRFPNVLVLARHMEAMLKALSRPVQEVKPTSARADSSTAVSATAAASPEMTRAAADRLSPMETYDSDVFDAVTVADSPTQKPDSAVPSALQLPQQPTATLRETQSGGKRFTTVDEDRARQVQHESSERIWLGVQLAVLAAAIGGLAWLGWRLTRPADADALYAEIMESVEADDPDALRSVSGEIADFLDRFPNDARATEVTALAGELELQRLDRQLRIRSRLFPGKPQHPAALAYAQALATQDTDPALAISKLEDLLALYGDASQKSKRDVRPYLLLAERQLEAMRGKLARQASQQLPELEGRLSVALSLETSEREQAIRMYEAIVRLYGSQAWAAPVVDRANARLEQLSRD